MKTKSALLAALGAILLLTSCGDAPTVMQGTVLGYDAGAKVLTVRDEMAPNKEIVLDLGKAAVGADPEKGDVVRAAYRAEQGRLVAIRVMNLTRQKELSK